MVLVNCFNIAGRVLLCALLPVFNLHADDMQFENQPSMDFLEYLGGVEHEIDGRLSSPVELDLEAALVASNSGKQKIDEVKAGNEASNEASNEGSVDE